MMAQLKYHEIWDAFEARLRSLFLHCNGKQVVIWGYGHSGRFLEHVFRRHGKQIELRMDADGKVRGVERPVILGQLDPETHVVLLTFPPTEDVIERLERHGFRRGTSYLPVVEFFYGREEVRGLNYHDWIEHMAPSTDLWKTEMDVNAASREFSEFSRGAEYSLVEVLDNFCFTQDDRIFDYGCGKGSALVLFERAGVSWGGIEYDSRMYDTCIRNLQELGLPIDSVHQGNAAEFSEIDVYNYFYMYNPFVGETFRAVIYQMEASWKRKPRVMTLIYSNPFCHASVVSHGIFRWTKTIPADFYIPDVYVYQTKAE